MCVNINIIIPTTNKNTIIKRNKRNNFTNSVFKSLILKQTYKNKKYYQKPIFLGFFNC